MLCKEGTGTCNLASVISAQAEKNRKPTQELYCLFKNNLLFQLEEPTLEMSVLDSYIIRVNNKIPVH